MELIDLSKESFTFVSQWGIGKSGRGVEFFEHLKHSKQTIFILVRHPAK